MNPPRPLQRQLWMPGGHWTWLSIALYAAACLLPAMPAFLGDSPIPGWACVAVVIYTFPPWWANPAYYVSLILTGLKRLRAAAVFAVIAALLAVSFEFLRVSELGWSKAFFGQEIGCYVWIASLEIQAINLLCGLWLDGRERQSRQHAGLTVEPANPA